MKIVFVTELTHKGGVDTFLVTLLKKWPRAEDELLVLTNLSHPGLGSLSNALRDRAQVQSHGIATYVDRVLMAATNEKRRIRLFTPFLRINDAVRSYFSFRKLFSQISPDRVMIVSGGFPGGDSGRIAAFAWASIAGTRPKVIFNVHNLAVPLSIWNFMGRVLDSFLARSVDSFVAVSKACADSIRVRPSIWESGKVSYILNGIEPKNPLGKREIIREEYGLKATCPLVVMLATYEPRKGHRMLLEAFSRVVTQIPDARLIACGFGYPGDIQQLDEVRHRLGLNAEVIFSGFRNDPAELLAVADVVAIPTQSYESFGLVAAEAMSLGIPVVATNVGGLPEVVTNGVGGFVVAPDDVVGFAKHLVDLLRDVNLRREQGRLGYQCYRQRFTAERMANDYATLIASDDNL